MLTGGAPSAPPASAAAAAAAARVAKEAKGGSPESDVKGKRPAQPLDIDPGRVLLLSYIYLCGVGKSFAV